MAEFHHKHTIHGPYKQIQSTDSAYMFHFQLKEAQVYLDALHCDVIDHSYDASGPGYSQQGVTCVGVVGPSTRVEVLICLCTA